jgi:hypothetical protein
MTEIANGVGVFTVTAMLPEIFAAALIYVSHRRYGGFRRYFRSK